jgi:hypothetical protein
MVKSEALEILNAKLERTDGEDWVQELIEKFNTVPENAYANCNDFLDLRIVINEYKKPSNRKPSATKKVAYLELTTSIEYTSEKAIGFGNGNNGMHGSNYKEYIQWIPNSKIVEVDNKIFIPAWIVAKNNLWDVVNKENKIVK